MATEKNRSCFVALVFGTKIWLLFGMSCYAYTQFDCFN